VYEAAREDDGLRVLVDRLWPRGLKKEEAKVDIWCRDIAPSNELRKWYGHEPSKWDEFRQRYAAELDAHEDGVAELESQLSGEVTFLYSSKETELNNATALKEYIDARAKQRGR
jgi:uncharacterized protein YeaO (DUF488 family)